MVTRPAAIRTAVGLLCAALLVAAGCLAGYVRFDTDRDGNPRPEEGPWGIGACQHK